ncbi:TetR/AcrR family transcriptional regulator [Sciscionella sediminilitoris]|uniref:TetR/AcrR family transcriptional regulator n=1 Tax=Sciscionella sediminilitoris TaxID=1445613 RepID=UPI0004DF64BA|nr:TetR/AcrR family transcriptional regulator [Sciscionella sp. SE31]
MPEFVGASDPARSMALLWRGAEQGKRKGGKDISVDKVLAAGIEIADAHGLGMLSMRKVAEHLGVGTMSLYTYVPGKAELLDVMVDAVYAGCAAPYPEEADWRDRLRQVAEENWALYQRHPWLRHIASPRGGLGPNVIAKYEHELRAVDGIGLSDMEMDLVIGQIGWHVHSAAREHLDAAELEAHSGVSDMEWWSTAGPLLSRVLPADRFPVATRVGTAAGEENQAASNPKRLLAFGLERILGGIEALLAGR